MKSGRDRQVSAAAATVFAAKHCLQYEEVSGGAAAVAAVPFTTLVRAAWDRPAPLARLRSRQAVAAVACCSVGLWPCSWGWSGTDAPPPEPWRAVRTAELQVAEMVLVSREASRETLAC